MDQKLSIVKMSVFLKLTHVFDAVSNLSRVFVAFQKLILKFIGKRKEPKVNTSVEKHKAGGFTALDMTTTHIKL